IAPLIVPLVITGTAVLYVVDELDIEGTFEGILLGHIVLALPFAYLVIESALRGYDTSLEDAAVTLGAGRARAFRAVTLPAIAPALFAAAAFAFIASWDDVVVARFLSGSVGLQTLPIRMYMFMSTQIRPTIAAISSLLITTLFVALLAWEAWRAVRRRRVA
ncbi:MAG: ABC transporter permease subunit, partial [Dehalococcoidia bacterium]|nr:ABC transporter permease subunit [Dehalococcoidia bacterium]